MNLIIQTLLALGVKLLTSSAIEDFLVFVASETVKRTDTKVDDDFLALVKKHLGKA